MKAAIFDVDGTLVDSVDLHAKAWQDAFAHFGHVVPFQKIRERIGKGGDQLMPDFLSKPEMDARGETIEKWRGEHFRRVYLSRVKSFPAVRELFLRLREDGWQLALASSAKKAELKVYKTLARVDDLLDAETCADDAEKSKPHPDIFQAAVDRLRVLPEDCVVIGDSPYDVIAAAKAKIPAVGFLCGGFAEADLKASGFRALYKDAADLLAKYDASVFGKSVPHTQS